ncbi:serine hydrolase domain-containing protein [Actinomadura miaoliensis]|uniref:Serine hydrolase domain-containing protein n=1 Tax=Actinomadura miaoliensis TaxID=430685 RepID=A0ABP7W5Y5_9ACTN
MTTTSQVLPGSLSLRLLVLPTVFALTVCGAATASAATRSHDAGRLRHDIEAITALGVTGVQARVSRGGRDVVATGGVGDVVTGRPVPPDGRFRIGSATKTFTATVVLQLAGEGRLSLDDTVERRLPGVVRGNGNDGRKITLRHLLQHTSGIHDDWPGWETPADFYRHRFDVNPPQQLVTRAMRHRPDFAPGTGWNYSNTGYILLGMVIERVTGRPWDAEVDRRIVRPLGLRHTGFPGLSPDLPRPHAHGYARYAGGELVDVTRNREGYTAASGGGIVSTTGDLARFFRALFEGELLRPAQLAQMKRTVPVSDEYQKIWPGARYGLGLFSRPLSCGGRYWGHSGDITGYMTRNGFTDDGRRGVVLSLSTELQDSMDSLLRQDAAASTLVDHALCATR